MTTQLKDRIKELINQLRWENHDSVIITQHEAASELVQLGEPTVPFLIEALTKGDYISIRGEAAQILARIGEPAEDIIRGLTRALEAVGYDSYLREKFIQALHDIDSNLSIHHLAETLVEMSQLRKLEGKCESPIELKLLREMVNHGLHKMLLARLELQYVVPEAKTRLDFAYPTLKLAIYCDGYDYHGRTKAQVNRDTEQNRKLQELDWKVLRYTGSQIHGNIKETVHQINRFVIKGIETKVMEKGV